MILFDGRRGMLAVWMMMNMDRWQDTIVTRYGTREGVMDMGEGDAVSMPRLSYFAAVVAPRTPPCKIQLSPIVITVSLYSSGHNQSILPSGNTTHDSLQSNRWKSYYIHTTSCDEYHTNGQHDRLKSERSEEFTIILYFRGNLGMLYRKQCNPRRHTFIAS